MYTDWPDGQHCPATQVSNLQLKKETREGAEGAGGGPGRGGWGAGRGGGRGVGAGEKGQPRWKELN